jgi:hypothetical protein
MDPLLEVLLKRQDPGGERTDVAVGDHDRPSSRPDYAPDLRERLRIQLVEIYGPDCYGLPVRQIGNHRIDTGILERQKCCVGNEEPGSGHITPAPRNHQGIIIAAHPCKAEELPFEQDPPGATERI